MDISTGKKPLFFKTQAAWHTWLEKNHLKKTELLVGFHKRHTATLSISWKESVDEALCFGWIDGVRKSIDEHSYTIRFTPRKKSSIWSAVNIKRIGELKELGLLHPTGLHVFKNRDKKKANLYSFERKNISFAPEQEKQFKANTKAWKYFESMPPSYRTPATWWVISAKQEATRERRLATLISDSEAEKKIKPLSY